jgi:phosphatidate cytidylyltransferase
VKQRLIVGLGGLAILLPCVVWGAPWMTDIFVTIAMFVAVVEFTRMAIPERLMLGYGAFGGSVALVHAANLFWPEMLGSALATGGMVCLITGLLAVPDTDRGARAGAWMVLGLVYIPVMFGMVSAVRRLEDGVAWVFVCLALAWAADTGAYFAGRAFGKTPLFPRVSPKKTWEGAIGGAVAVLVAIGIIRSLAIPHMGWGHVVALSLIGGPAGVVGDLVESAFKRASGVKDSGSILPGHGGILDRVDSLLFTAPVTYVYVTSMGLG